MTVLDKMSLVTTVVASSICRGTVSLSGSIVDIISVVYWMKSRSGLFFCQIDAKFGNLFSKFFISLVGLVG